MDQKIVSKMHAGSVSIPLNHQSKSSSDTRYESETCTQLIPLSSQLDSMEEVSYEFNIQQFLDEKGYHRDRNNFDKNLHLAEGMSTFPAFR